jgi:hypothetical protein
LSPSSTTTGSSRDDDGDDVHSRHLLAACHSSSIHHGIVNVTTKIHNDVTLPSARPTMSYNVNAHVTAAKPSTVSRSFAIDCKLLGTTVSKASSCACATRWYSAVPCR